MNNSDVIWFVHELTPLKVVRLGRSKAVAHEAAVNYREPTQPNPGYNEADVGRSVRPKGKKCRQ